MKTIEEYRNTSNNKAYNKARKMYLANIGAIDCGYCPYHKGENRKSYAADNTCWKRYRKTQYK